MPTFDETSAECLVYTYKDGLLSAIGHDLVIRVGRLAVTVDAATLAVEARFDAASLRVVSAAHPGDPGQTGRTRARIPLGEGDKRKIEGTIRDEVLASRLYPEARFSSTTVTPVNGGFHVEGTLTLRGRPRPVALDARPEGDRLTAEITLHQPDFGIAPYSAMLGALKLEPSVKVRVSLPRAAANGG
jgi:YceI-like domain